MVAALETALQPICCSSRQIELSASEHRDVEALATGVVRGLFIIFGILLILVARVLQEIPGTCVGIGPPPWALSNPGYVGCSIVDHAWPMEDSNS